MFSKVLVDVLYVIWGAVLWNIVLSLVNRNVHEQFTWGDNEFNLVFSRDHKIVSRSVSGGKSFSFCVMVDKSPLWISFHFDLEGNLVDTYGISGIKGEKFDIEHWFYLSWDKESNKFIAKVRAK